LQTRIVRALWSNAAAELWENISRCNALRRRDDQEDYRNRVRPLFFQRGQYDMHGDRWKQACWRICSRRGQRARRAIVSVSHSGSRSAIIR